MVAIVKKRWAFHFIDRCHESSSFGILQFRLNVHKLRHQQKRACSILGKAPSLHDVICKRPLLSNAISFNYYGLLFYNFFTWQFQRFREGRHSHFIIVGRWLQPGKLRTAIGIKNFSLITLTAPCSALSNLPNFQFAARSFVKSSTRSSGRRMSLPLNRHSTLPFIAPGI